MCSQCHGLEGKGDGSIVNLGKFPAPPSYSTGNSSRGGSMKDLTDGKIYHTITHGVNLMGPHKSQLSPEQRWKVVMYVHELQKLQ
jgi:mono/diheme cytochrome c family protein